MPKVGTSKALNALDRRIAWLEGRLEKAGIPASGPLPEGSPRWALYERRELADMRKARRAVERYRILLPIARKNEALFRRFVDAVHDSMKASR